MTSPQRFAPEALSVRKGAKHNTFESSGALPTSLDGVVVTLTPTTQAHEYSAPMEEGDAMRRLRRYGLMLSRYGLVNKRKFAHRTNTSIEAVSTAERIVASTLYTKVFGDDPTIGTVNLTPLAELLDRPDPSPSAMAAALSYVGTQAQYQLLEMIKTPHVREILESNYRDLGFYAEREPYKVQYYINKEGKNATRSANNAYERLVMRIKREVEWGQHMVASHLNRMAEEEASKRKQAQEAMGKDNLDRRNEQELNGRRFPHGADPKRVMRQIVPAIDGWATPILEKLPLTIPHTGRKGRKLVPMSYGKSIKFIAREDTDPEQRVFARKTRAIGGVVVVDCSGSMSLDDNDLRMIMDAACGATVICYSGGGGVGEPNIWLVASRGRRTSTLPYFPGNNSVDGPALEVGMSMRRHNEPVVWITDTHVTGAGDICSTTLRDWCLLYAGRHNIHIVRRPEEAATLLRSFQNGSRPKRKKFETSKGVQV